MVAGFASTDIAYSRISFLEKEYSNLWHSIRNLYNHLELEEQIRPEMRVVVKKKEQSF